MLDLSLPGEADFLVARREVIRLRRFREALAVRLGLVLPVFVAFTLGGLGGPLEDALDPTVWPRWLQWTGAIGLCTAAVLIGRGVRLCQMTNHLPRGWHSSAGFAENAGAVCLQFGK